MMTKAKTVSAAELGELLGLAKGTVANMAADGILPRAAERGRYDAPACVQAYVKHRLASENDPAVVNLTEQRSRLARLKADAAEREAMLEAGELVPADDVRKTWMSMASAIRSRMLLIPAKIAPRIVTKAPAEAQALLQSEIHAALSELAEGSV